MNYKNMRRKTTSLRLVEDRFLTKKFKHKNQHELSFWFNELAPDNEWFSGEIAFKGTEIISKRKRLFAFAIYVNENYNTINVAELEANGIETEKELLDKTLVGKEIISVMRVDNVDPIMWESSENFQKKIHTALANYVDRKAERVYRQSLLK